MRIPAPRRSSALGLAAAAALTGCYGQTDLATRIDRNSATLNSRGTANNGPASAYFEYWKTSTPGVRLQTPTTAIPGGASGPFHARATGLAPDTSYSFRLCGGDQGKAAVCAQTRSFFTGRSSVQAYGDTSAPYGEAGWDRIDVNAVAAPPGGGPSGRLFTRVYNAEAGPPGGIALELGSTTVDNVTCMIVQGNVAVVGFRQVPPFGDSLPIKSQMFAVLVDGGPAGSGRDRFAASVEFTDRDPNDCAIPTNLDAVGPLRKGEVAISEIPPVP